MIAFVSDRGFDGNDVWTVQPTGGGLRALTRNRTQEWAPAWSPDGRRLAYHAQAESPRSSRISVLDPARRTVRTVSPRRAVDFDPAWAPDGARIAFASAVGRSRPDLYVMHANGAARRRLAALPGCEGAPAWSPDGTAIAFESSNCRGAPAIAVMRSDGTATRVVSAFGRDPAWSPDGTQLAFVGREGVHVVGAGGVGERVLVSRVVENGGPAWSPDGKSIVVSLQSETATCSARDLTAELALVRADGSGMTTLSESDCWNDFSADWQPRCTLYGSAASDRLVGTPGRDVVCGLGGADDIRAGDGDDVVIGGDGDDTLAGGAGADRLFGSGGRDRLVATDGAVDVADGGPGSDVCVCDPADRLASSVRR